MHKVSFLHSTVKYNMHKRKLQATITQYKCLSPNRLSKCNSRILIYHPLILFFKFMKNIIRCSWVEKENNLYEEYHDTEWGREVHDDRLLFEMLILEGAEAGLSWLIVLKKRSNYKMVFDDFDVDKIVKYDNKKVQELLNYSGIIRNKLKINSVIRNAKVFIKIQNEYQSFDKYLWNFVDGKQIINQPKDIQSIRTTSDLSDRISKDLKSKGMNFVGSTIIYAYLQAVGVIDDHEKQCFSSKTKKPHIGFFCV